MASTTLSPTADLIVAVINALTTSETVTATRWDPGMAGFDKLPAAAVGVPTIRRVGVDQPESQIGSRDWEITFPVTFYIDLAEAGYAQALAVEIAEAFIKAIDTESLQSSDASIIDAKVTESHPAEYVDDARPLLAYETTLELLKLV